MNRWLLLLGLMLVSGASLAATQSFPNLFTPVDQDLSIWYLGNIFGSDLLGGLVNSSVPISGIRLLSVLFGIFNQIALTVGIIIIVYTVLAGTLNTAHEGKPLGEKWNSMWMPVRISMGIALLVPKGGTGYCLAQSLVMWLTLQGVGAADQVWNAMIDYFAKGGAIYSDYTAQNTDFMTLGNIEYTLFLQGRNNPTIYNQAGGAQAPSGVKTPTASLLDGMICVNIHNSDPNALALSNGNQYSVYTDASYPDTLFFGDYKAHTANTGGTECGAVVSTLPNNGCDDSGKNCATPANRKSIYTLANWNMAQGLQGLAKQLVTAPDDENNWDQFYQDVYHNSDLYINYIVGYESLLSPYDTSGENGGLKASSSFGVYKQYGWILAGNYYTVLSAFKEQANYTSQHFRPAAAISWVPNTSPTPTALVAGTTPNYETWSQRSQFWASLYSETESPLNFIGTYIPTYGQSVNKNSPSGASQGLGHYKIGIVDMNRIYGAISNGLIKGGDTTKGTLPGQRKQHNRGSGAPPGAADLITRSQVENYIRYLTGAAGTAGPPGDLTVAKDPILTISDYGKSLTSGAVALFVIVGTLQVLSSTLQICVGLIPAGYFINALMELTVWPLLGLAAFMYGQGAILGVYIPLIPYLTFFIGVVGWLLQVVEAISAAPLVAIGLVFPETTDDIWGKAKPAYMMILGLFLRPPLMLVGFAAAMIVLWVLTELLNIGFLTLTTVTFRIEDMFGFVTIMTAYTAVFTIVVTRAYELINIVPNKVLSWIGDSSMQVESAGTALSAAQTGTQQGAGSTVGGFQAAQQAGNKAGEQVGKGVMDRLKKSGGGGSSSST